MIWLSVFMAQCPDFPIIWVYLIWLTSSRMCGCHLIRDITLRNFAVVYYVDEFTKRMTVGSNLKAVVTMLCKNHNVIEMVKNPHTCECSISLCASLVQACERQSEWDTSCINFLYGLSYWVAHTHCNSLWDLASKRSLELIMYHSCDVIHLFSGIWEQRCGYKPRRFKVFDRFFRIVTPFLLLPHIFNRAERFSVPASIFLMNQLMWHFSSSFFFFFFAF